MNTEMSAKTKTEVMKGLRKKYVRAGAEYRVGLIDQAVELFGYHRKAAIRALNAPPVAASGAVWVRAGRPREYHREALLEPLKAIWFAAQQPCGSRLAAMLPEWVPAYEAEHRRLTAEVREALLAVSARTLDRLLEPLRASAGRRGGTRPGSLLRQSIPIRGQWSEEGPGWVELDTVALCGGRLDDLHAWMLDVVDIRTDWTELRALANRDQHSTLEQVRDVEKSLPFALLGADSDNGGEFINHHLVRYFQERKKPVLVTRARPYHKNDNAHVEQRNSDPCAAALRLRALRQPGGRPAAQRAVQRRAGRVAQPLFVQPQTARKTAHQWEDHAALRPRAKRLRARARSGRGEDEKTKARLRAEHAALNPFALAREIERQKKKIEVCRLLRA